MTFLDIIRDVAIKHNVTKDQILGYVRIGRVVRARQEAFARVRDDCKLSYPNIGRLFRRDHATIIHGIRRHRHRNSVNEAQKTTG